MLKLYGCFIVLICNIALSYGIRPARELCLDDIHYDCKVDQCYHWYTQNRCPYTCGCCFLIFHGRSCSEHGQHTPPVPTANCNDMHEYCAQWAGIGECTENPNYMLVSCKKSCGECGSSAPSTTTTTTTTLPPPTTTRTTTIETTAMPSTTLPTAVTTTSVQSLYTRFSTNCADQLEEGMCATLKAAGDVCSKVLSVELCADTCGVCGVISSANCHDTILHNGCHDQYVARGICSEPLAKYTCPESCGFCEDIVSNMILDLINAPPTTHAPTTDVPTTVAPTTDAPTIVNVG